MHVGQVAAVENALHVTCMYFMQTLDGVAASDVELGNQLQYCKEADRKNTRCRVIRRPASRKAYLSETFLGVQTCRSKPKKNFEYSHCFGYFAAVQHPCCSLAWRLAIWVCMRNFSWGSRVAASLPY